MKRLSAGTALIVLAALTAAQSAQASEGAGTTPKAATDSGAIPLSLEEAVRIGVARSFRAARAKRNEAVADLRGRNARSGYLPRLDAGLSAEHTHRSYAEQGVDYDPYAGRDFRGGLNSSLWLPIDVSGVVKRQVAQAETQEQISANEVSQTKLDLAFDVQNNYLNALRAQQNVTADERMVQQIADLLDRSRNRAPGVVPFLEVELGNAQQSLTSSRTNADEAQDGLKQSLRMPLETKLRLTTEMTHDSQPDMNGDLLRQAIETRPDIRQARLRVRQADISARQVTDSRKPSVSVGGYLNQDIVGADPMDHDRRRISNRGLGVNVKVPIAQYDGGQLGRQKRIAGLQKEQAQADSEELKERVAYDLRQALLAVERAEARIKSVPDKQQAFAALKRAEEQMLAAPDGQAQSLLAQVSNARGAWRSAETASADADIDYNRALFRLKRTIGVVDGVEEPSSSATAAVPIVNASSL